VQSEIARIRAGGFVGCRQLISGSGVENRANATARRARSSSASGRRSALDTKPTASPTMTRSPSSRDTLCFRLSMWPLLTCTVNARLAALTASA
jgi:hypothetical protein